MRKKFAVFLLAALFASAYVSGVHAEELLRAEPPDEDAQLGLSVNLNCDDESLEGVGISLYRVAEVEWDGGGVAYTALTGDIDYEGMTADESSEAAEALAESDLSELVSFSGATDENGEAQFSLPDAGMYLVVQDSVKGSYTFAPFLVPVPEAIEEDGIYVWNYEVECEPKLSVLAAEETAADTDDETETADADEGTESGDTGDETESEDTGSAQGVKTWDDSRRGLYLLFSMTAAAAAAGTAACRFRRI